jgi:hypothetical protein
LKIRGRKKGREEKTADTTFGEKTKRVVTDYPLTRIQTPPKTNSSAYEGL